LGLALRLRRSGYVCVCVCVSGGEGHVWGVWEIYWEYMMDIWGICGSDIQTYRIYFRCRCSTLILRLGGQGKHLLLTPHIHTCAHSFFLLPPFNPAAVVSLLQTLCLFTLPESPKWLLERGRLSEAYKALEMKFGNDSFNQQWGLLRTQRAYHPSGSGTSVRIELEIENLFKLMHPDLNGGLSPRASHSRGLSSRNSHSNRSSSGGTDLGNISPSRSNNSAGVLRDSDSDSDSDSDRTSSPGKAVAALAQFRQDMNQEGALIYEYSFPILFLLAFQAFTQLSGGVVIRNYAATIFADNGNSEVQALRAVTILGT